MEFLTIEFNHYDLYYASANDIEQNDWIIQIACYGKDSMKSTLIKNKNSINTLEVSINKNQVGTINFYKDDLRSPKGIYLGMSKDGKNILLIINYPISQFNDVISILRYYENQSLYLFLEPGSFKGGISTSSTVWDITQKAGTSEPTITMMDQPDEDDDD